MRTRVSAKIMFLSRSNIGVLFLSPLSEITLKWPGHNQGETKKVHFSAAFMGDPGGHLNASAKCRLFLRGTLH